MGERSLAYTGEIQKDRIIAYLLDEGNRLSVENALAVEFLLENADQECEAVYTRAYDAWEHMTERKPEITPLGSEEFPSDAEVRLFEPDGSIIRMKFETRKKLRILRSFRGNPQQRKGVEKQWSNRKLPPRFLIVLAKRHRDPKARTARIGG